MNIRWYLFWIKDFFEGSKVRKAYKDIKKNYYNIDKKEQKEKIEKILKYVNENVEYYSEYKNYDINKFPVVNKQIINDNFDKFFVSKYDINKLHAMPTSGSTGMPFTVYQNPEKRTRVAATVIFFGEVANYKFGEKQMYFRIWTKANKKSKFQLFLFNMIPMDTSKLDDESLKDVMSYIEKTKKLSCIMGYAQTYSTLYKYLNKTNYKYKGNKINCFISSAELLDENVRKNLSKIFNCKVYSRYANEELGIMGQDNGIDKEFILDEANYYFEFLKLDRDEPAEKGEVSRIVVTDFYNYSMPLIRYDTGDLAVYDERNGKRYIKEIYGRVMDLIYDTKGNSLSPATITVNMWGVNVKQYKFQQVDKKKYNLIINLGNGNKEEIEKEITTKFPKILGEDAIITFEYVDEIPTLASGKWKAVENLMKKR